MNPRLFLILLAALWCGSSPAQLIPEAVICTGTSTLDASGRPWLYVFWQTGPDVSADQSYAIFTKSGAPSSPGSFTQREIVRAADDPQVLSVLQGRAENLGRPRAAWERTLEAIYGELGGGTLTGAQRFAAVLASRPHDRYLGDLLNVAAQREPVLAMALGRAWGGLANVAIGTPVTVELRGWDPAARAVGGVVGRVTLTAGQPAELAAPGVPVQVPDSTATGDRIIKLRWSTPDPLRRQMPKTTGIHLWRVDAAAAESRGWHTTPPARVDLLGLAAGSPTLAKRVTETPVESKEVLTAAQAVNFDPAAPNDFAKLHFFADDNKAARPIDGNDPGGPYFDDGARYYYFAAAADLLGQPGLLSPGGLARARLTLPPAVPLLEVAVDESYLDPALAAPRNHRPVFALHWQPNPETGGDLTTHYELYRSTLGPEGTSDLAELTDPVRQAALVPFATVPHAAGGVEILRALDTRTAPVEEIYGKTFWFSLRAVRERPWGRVVSAFSPPVLAAIRDQRPMTAPTDPEAFGMIPNCPRASVIISGGGTSPLTTEETITQNNHYRAVCDRANPGVLWAEFRVLNGNTEQLRERIFFPAETDATSVQVDFVSTVAPQVFCVVGSDAGALSPSPGPGQLLAVPGSGQRTIVTFTAAALDDAGLVAGSPISEPLLLTPFSVIQPEVAAAGLMRGTLPGAAGSYVVTSGGRTAGHGFAVNSVLLFYDLLAVPGLPVPGSYQARQVLNTAPADAGPCVQVLEDPLGSGALRPLTLRFRLTEGTRQYRIWRRVDGGTAELLGQAPATFDRAQPNKEVVFRDIALPPFAAEVAYFAQLSARDGQDSPLIPLGTVRPSRLLPAPVLGSPESVTVGGQPAMRLTWTCPSAGVARFEIAMKGDPLPLNPATKPAWANSAGLFNFAGSSGLVPPKKFTVSHQRKNFGSLVEKTVLDERERTLTGYVGEALLEDPPGSGRFVFDVTGISKGVKYSAITVTAVGHAPESRGPSSNAQSFTWVAEPSPEQVAWPARPLPPQSAFHPAVQARLLDYRSGSDTRLRAPYPLGQSGDEIAGILRPGVLIGRSGVRSGAGGYSVAASGPEAGLFRMTNASRISRAVVDPNAMILRRPEAPADLLLPVVLYRQVVATGEVMQVTPLMEKIAWQQIAVSGQTFDDGLVRDPYVGAVVSTGPVFDFYLLDTQPVTAGETYRYLLVRFDARSGEMTETINAGELTIPEDQP